MLSRYTNNFVAKGMPSIEKHLGRATATSDSAAHVKYGSWFVFTGQIDHFFQKLFSGDPSSVLKPATKNGSIKAFFETNQNWFYGTTFVINCLSALLYMIKYFFVGNRNLSNTANLILRIVGIFFLCVMAYGAVVFGPQIAMVALAISVFWTPVTHFIKTFYFAMKTLFGDEERKEFYFERTIQNMLVVIIGGIIIGGLTPLFFMTGAPLVALGVIGIIGAVIVLAAQIYQLYHFFKGIKNDPASQEEEELEIPEEDTPDIQGSTKLLQERLLASPSDKKYIPEPDQWDFYQYTVTPSLIDLDKLKGEIESLKEGIDCQKNETGIIAWFERGKRENKVKALTFLLTFIEQMDSIPSSSKGEKFDIAGVPFKYRNKEHLIQQMEAHVLKTYSGVYQSFFKNIGRVQASFNMAFQAFRSGAVKLSPGIMPKAQPAQ